jgi:phosphoribosyl-ATP pyrophosphohydrolase
MAEVLAELEGVLRARLAERPAGSYSATLFDDRELLQRKVMEEAFEVCLEFGRATPARERVAAEVADLLFHVLAALVATDVPLDDVLAELARRRR